MTHGEIRPGGVAIPTAGDRAAIRLAFRKSRAEGLAPQAVTTVVKNRARRAASTSVRAARPGPGGDLWEYIARANEMHAKAERQELLALADAEIARRGGR